MFGWDSWAELRASVRNRSRNPSSPANSSRSTFTATSRASDSSCATQTSPMPPTAIRDTSRYRSPRATPSAGFIASPPGRQRMSRSSQRRLDDGSGDRSGHCPAGRLVAHAPAVLDDHRDSHAGGVGRCERGEPRVRGGVLGGLGGTRLAGHLDPGDLGRPARAVGHDTDHHVPQGGGRACRDGPAELGRAVSAGTAAALRDMMVGVVANGTGRAAQIAGIQVAGKTGTAQTSEDAAPHAWFTAFAPADAPRVAVAVIVENGGSLGNEATGGAVAAPIARAVIEAALR